MDSTQKPALTIPAAIIIAAAIVAAAIIIVRTPPPAAPVNDTAKQETAVQVAAVSSADHILGNPAAPIQIVEFSDPSCPFCKTFHPTMVQLMNTYGPGGQVAWIYRHFPLDKPNAQGQVLHPNAGRESQALECAAALGGNDAFWKYTNRLYEITPSVTGATPTGLNQAELPNIARYAGLDATAFDECLSSGRFAEKVNVQYLDGVTAGVSGTPTSIIILSKAAPKTMEAILYDQTVKLRVPLLISSDRMKIVLPGALPMESMRAILDPILAELK